MMRKVETQLGLSLIKVCRQVLAICTRILVWETKTKKLISAAIATTLNKNFIIPVHFWWKKVKIIIKS